MMLDSEELEIDTSDSAEWPADPEEWPRNLVVRDIDGGGKAVYARVMAKEGDDDA
jgi:hypothetical protein